MCLYIHPRYHKKNIFNHYKPLVAKENILVYKWLHRIGDVYITPFLYERVPLSCGQALLSVKKFKVIYFSGDIVSVNQGIHAKTVNEKHLDKDDLDGIKRFAEEHLAVIPKGARFYIGDEQDVVSDRLFIYESAEDYLNFNAEGKLRTINDIYGYKGIYDY